MRSSCSWDRLNDVSFTLIDQIQRPNGWVFKWILIGLGPLFGLSQCTLGLAALSQTIGIIIFFSDSMIKNQSDTPMPCEQ